VLVLGAAGVAVAVTDPFDGNDNDRLTGQTLDKASSAALAEVGSGTVSDAESSEDLDHAYEVEVTLDNGEDVDVHLDESFTVVRVDGVVPGSGSSAPTDASTDGATDGATDTATPNDTDTDSDNLPALTEADTSAASAAALAALPAGTVGTITELERSDDFDHAYEVEVTLENGQDIDVELDANFAVVTVDGVVPAA
jgi:uncharacterized membrane protein YkoI